MPATTDIIAQTTQAAQGALVLALAWHVLLAAACIALVAGWRPPARLAALLIAAPLGSVALVAMAYRNPFNAIVFAGLAIQWR